MRCPSEICTNLELALQREWLETNGLGGFASSTIAGANTRRYHGLLTVAVTPPVGRMVMLSKLEETVLIGDRSIELGTNEYPGAIYPQGYRLQSEFQLDPIPTFRFGVEGGEVEKRLCLIQGEHTLVVRYRFTSTTQSSVRLKLRPLVAGRDYHSLMHENGAVRREWEQQPGLLAYQPYSGVPTLYFAQAASEIHSTGDWYRQFHYVREQERGLDDFEDLFQPFAMSFDLSPGRDVYLIVSTHSYGIEEAASLMEEESSRRIPIPEGDAGSVLRRAARQFIVSRGNRKTIIAGYPWFTDWGRDTMISLPGLVISTEHFDEARDILLEFAANTSQGMLPNRFRDDGSGEDYNTSDAALGFFEAVRSLYRFPEQRAWIRQHLYAVMVDMLCWHERGTRYGIGMDSDGLLRAGEPGCQLTWMDAKVGDWVVTPRHGKPVEIQALWYNALRTMEAIARDCGDEKIASWCSGLADRARTSFLPAFWNGEAECLYDVVNGEDRDASIRPNQILAVSLAHSMLPMDEARKVVKKVAEELLTPYGLRTLAPMDARYHPRFEGAPHERDAAYHQGTAWPWLMGPFVSAYLKVNGDDPNAKTQARSWLQPLLDFAQGRGMGQLPEVFDGSEPQRPGGCFAQAWSVAEVLRVVAEELS